MRALKRNRNKHASTLRFLEGDQFTIYIPEKIETALQKNNEKSATSIAKLCAEVQTYFLENELAAGKLSSASSAVDANINFRQTSYDYKRVNAVGENDQEILAGVKAQQEGSFLYQFLMDSLPKFLQLEKFKSAYRQQYKSEFWKNPFSTMKRNLEKLGSFGEVKKYAEKHPRTRTAQILKRL